MISKVNKILFLLLISVSLLIANDIKNKSEETIENVFNGNVEYEMTVFNIPGEIKNRIERETRQKFFQDKLYIWKVRKNGKLLGFAVLDNVLGKSLPITFLVIFDTDCRIINSSIIQYREPYGGAVKNENWNAQFKNKDSSSSYEVGKEINGISGATISVHSVSKGIHKLALLLPQIKDRL